VTSIDPGLILGSAAIVAGITLIAWCFIAIGLDRIGMRPIPDHSFDALVVLGCAVRADGHASAALRRRTLHAVDLWHKGKAPRLILTGGVGKYPPAESAVSADLAELSGVPRDVIFLEERSTSTRENARFAATVHPDAPDWSVLVVTDGYHCWRSQKLFGHHFSHAATAGSQPGTRLRIRGALREVISILKLFLRPESESMK
jgi:uncharacterized SAM-binding protein YcdF (DUF218 family)